MILQNRGKWKSNIARNFSNHARPDSALSTNGVELNFIQNEFLDWFLKKTIPSNGWRDVSKQCWGCCSWFNCWEYGKNYLWRPDFNIEKFPYSVLVRFKYGGNLAVSLDILKSFLDIKWFSMVFRCFGNNQRSVFSKKTLHETQIWRSKKIKKMAKLCR